jgi:hypothetical protein
MDSMHRWTQIEGIEKIHVITKAKNVRIFIQSHNEKTFALAKYRFGHYCWAYPILVPGADTLNPLCENKMIVEYRRF